ncbi:MAG: amidohydrolase [Acidobacteria bacterium]|nr:MAG: amidohydrolase [Acidobacteriota bacterium]PYS09615.1 MAG: amidohydrolase [Acidobacteriota bacterium]
MHLLTRRKWMAQMAVLGASAALPKTILGLQNGSASPGRPFRIDTHSHFTIPKLYALSTAKGVSQPALKDWMPEKTLAQMEQGSVATSIISISDPGVWFTDNAAARALARECNEYGAKVVKDYPGRFGLFAVLPLPDVDGAVREVEYALDTLKADGIGILSSYQGKYLGNPAFTPLMEVLNRRKAVVFCHPYCAACDAQTTLTDAQNRGVEFVFDTTRTILSLLSTAAVARFPDIRFIWSHGGGTVPYITSRLAGVGQQLLPKGVMYELQKFYYDTAQAFNPYTMPSFKKMVPPSHILFGTDYPLGGGTAAIVANGLADNGGFTASEMRDIDRENALELLPRLRT